MEIPDRQAASAVLAALATLTLIAAVLVIAILAFGLLNVLFFHIPISSR
jgi:hypothetical protein